LAAGALAHLHHFPQLIGRDKRMPECPADFQPTVFNRAADADLGDTDDLGSLLNFVGDAS
jgi:hypothetical protein